jgi:hypothetical protein
MILPGLCYATFLVRRTHPAQDFSGLSIGFLNENSDDGAENRKESACRANLIKLYLEIAESRHMGRERGTQAIGANRHKA